MANLNITFYNTSNNKAEAIATTSVVGRKMSDSFMAKHYGKYWRDVYDVLFYVSKKNEYGIKWVAKHNGSWSVCANNSLPCSGLSGMIIVR